MAYQITPWRIKLTWLDSKFGVIRAQVDLEPTLEEKQSPFGAVCSRSIRESGGNNKKDRSCGRGWNRWFFRVHKVRILTCSEPKALEKTFRQRARSHRRRRQRRHSVSADEESSGIISGLISDLPGRSYISGTLLFDSPLCRPSVWSEVAASLWTLRIKDCHEILQL